MPVPQPHGQPAHPAHSRSLPGTVPVLTSSCQSALQGEHWRWGLCWALGVPCWMETQLLLHQPSQDDLPPPIHAMPPTASGRQWKQGCRPMQSCALAHRDVYLAPRAFPTHWGEGKYPHPLSAFPVPIPSVPDRAGCLEGSCPCLLCPGWSRCAGICWSSADVGCQQCWRGDRLQP